MDTHPVKPRPQPRAHLVHEFSDLNQTVRDMLSSTEAQLQKIENRVMELDDELGRPRPNNSSIAAELGQLEAQAVHLRTNGVDIIEIKELHGGQRAAKKMKKQIIARFDGLFESMGKISTRTKNMEERVNKGQIVEIRAADDCGGLVEVHLENQKPMCCFVSLV